MKKILSFNTIFSGVDIILQNTNEILINKNFESKKQSEILIASIKQVLSSFNLDFNDIDIFSTITGPGNFTGIKTSLSVLKALQISTNKNIITTDVFEILSYNQKNFDIILLDMSNTKYYIKEKDNYSIIHKTEIENFLNQNKNSKILTNDLNLKSNSIQYSEFSTEKWADLILYKAKNELFSDNISPLYIEEATITKRKQ